MKGIRRKTLFLNRIGPSKQAHDSGNDSREEGEESPYHRLNRLFVSNGYNRFTCSHIGRRNESSDAEEQGNERTGDSASEFLRHGTRGENQAGRRRAVFLGRIVGYVSIHRP